MNQDMGIMTTIDLGSRIQPVFKGRGEHSEPCPLNAGWILEPIIDHAREGVEGDVLVYCYELGIGLCCLMQSMVILQVYLYTYGQEFLHSDRYIHYS